MNVILVMSDSLRCDHLGAYRVPDPWQRPGHEGEDFIATPHLDQLAAESALFERFYLSSYPTVPCRADLFTGRFGFPFHGWQPLDPADVVLAEIVAHAGFTPMLIFDTPMLATDAYNFMRDFAGWDFVRGQHADRYNVDPIPTTLPAAVHKLKDRAATHRYLRNTAFRQSESDWMCAQTMTHAVDWLERNQERDDFVLWIDLWDPHEPFDAPADEIARYADPTYTGEAIIYPRYGRSDYMSDAERNHVRASYAALVMVMDRAMGRLLDALQRFGLDRNTLLIFMSDHGHLFGDHGLQGKPTGPLGKLFEVTTRVPLLIRHPEGIGAGKRIGGIAQHPDILPTVLEFLDIPLPEAIHGVSLWPLIRSDSAEGRPFAVSGRYSRLAEAPGRAGSGAASYDGTAGLDTRGEPLTLTTERWAYLCPIEGGGERALYDLVHDPGQATNVIDDQPEIASQLHAQLIRFLEDLDAPAERIDLYRDPVAGSAQTRLLPDATPLYVIHDGRNHLLAFRTREEAEGCLGAGVPLQPIEETTFGQVRDAHPQALIDLHEQYYWAEDLG